MSKTVDVVFPVKFTTVIPEGYELVRIGVPDTGELFVDGTGEILECQWVWRHGGSAAWVQHRAIVEKVETLSPTDKAIREVELILGTSLMELHRWRLEGIIELLKSAKKHNKGGSDASGKGNSECHV